MTDNGLTNVKTLYNSRQYGDALVAVEQFLAEHPDDARALGWKGWCHYQLGEYAQALTAASAGGDDPWALHCLLYLNAFKKTGFQDKTRMLAIARRISDKVVVANAYVIFASDPENECFLTRSEVMEEVMFHLAGQTISVAHLINNTAKWLRVHGTNTQDFLVTIGLFKIALVKYGTGDENAHHRAGAMFWMSKTLEDIGDVHSALVVARDSAIMWETACRIDPENKGHKSRHQSVLEYVERLQNLTQQRFE